MLIKKINNSIISCTFVLGTILSVSSCIAPSETKNLNININNKDVAIIHASDKKGSSVKMNIGSIIKSFSTKATQDGSTESLSMASIRIVLSENPIDPFNNPVNVNTSKFYFPAPANVVFDNLQAGKTYYISAKAYSTSTESLANNITEGGTYITTEYIQVAPNGAISIMPSDASPVGEINFTIPLKNIVGARVDVPVKLISGKMNDFKDKDSLVEKVASIPLTQPDVDITSGGDGAIVWRERTVGLGIKKIKIRTIRDYIHNGNSSVIYQTGATTDILNKPSVSLNSKNNGFSCWDYTVNAGTPVIHFKHINNFTTFGSLNTIGADYIGCDIQIKNTSSDSGAIVFTDNNIGFVIKGRALKSSDDFSSFTPANDLSSSDITISLNSGNSNPSLSKITKYGYALVVWQRLSGVTRQIISNKIKVDNSVTPPNLIVTPADQAVIESNNSSITLSNPSVAIDDNGDGFVVWQKGISPTDIIYSKIINFNPEGSLINITTSANATNPKVQINNKGNGLITWTQAQDIYGINIFGYEVVGNSFKINDLTGSDIQDSSTLDIDERGNGYMAWTDDRDSPPITGIYGKRIVDYYPN